MNNLLAVNSTFYAAFSRYARRFVRRNFNAIRMLRGAAPRDQDDEPVVIFLNHPSWWDPMIGLALANRFFSARSHYAPIDAAMLEKYRFFARLGFFGVEQETRRGAAQFLRVSKAIVSRPDAALWVTAEGQFKDVRARPISLRPGVAHLARHMKRGYVLPLGIEYAFWTERYPEALCAFGQPIPASRLCGHRVSGIQKVLRDALEETMDGLADAVVSRDPNRFEKLQEGRAGVGGAYDVMRRASAWVRGRRFDSRHQPESAS